METGYEMEPAPIGRSTDRKVPATLVAIVILLAVVVVKPWAGSAVEPATAPAIEHLAPSPAISGLIPSPDAASPVPAAADPPAPGWPVKDGPLVAASSSASEAEESIVAVATRARTWGVASAGLGPRLTRDEPWADWTGVVPEITGDVPRHVVMWPGTSLCQGLPAVDDRGTMIALTAPAAFGSGDRVVGWYTDGARSAALDGSVRQVSPEGGGAVSYLERIDRSPWPAGRYEFHLIVGYGTVGLTVCLTPFD